MTSELTPVENIIIDCMFLHLREERANRTTAEYVSIARRAPKAKALHDYVNQQLQAWAASGTMPSGICSFKAGDAGFYYKPFPIKVSIETVRTALKKFKTQCAVASGAARGLDT